MNALIHICTSTTSTGTGTAIGMLFGTRATSPDDGAGRRQCAARNEHILPKYAISIFSLLFFTVIVDVMPFINWRTLTSHGATVVAFLVSETAFFIGTALLTVIACVNYRVVAWPHPFARTAGLVLYTLQTLSTLLLVADTSMWLDNPDIIFGRIFYLFVIVRFSFLQLVLLYETF